MNIRAKHNNKKSFSSTGHWETPGPSRSGCCLVMFCLDSRRGGEQSSTEDSSLEDQGQQWFGGAPLLIMCFLILAVMEILPSALIRRYLGIPQWLCHGLQGGSVVKNPPVNAGNIGSIPGLGSSPGEGNGNPVQYSCLGNHMDRGAWRAKVHRVTKESDMTEWLNSNNNRGPCHTQEHSSLTWNLLLSSSAGS